MKKLFTLLVILSFTVSIAPFSSLAQNRTEFWGMTSDAENGGGLIFKTDASGNNQQVMRTFIQIPGQNPDFTQLCQAPNGKLYGMAYLGGLNNYGLLFEYNPVTNIYTKKIDFAGVTNGQYPHGSLILASNGKLYGMTQQGGANYMGVIFEYDPITNAYSKKYDFAGTTSGSYPYGSLTQASNGKLYGMTYQGGVNNMGVLFEYEISTGTFTKKLDFAGTTNGSYPIGSLLLASNGKLYGMTNQGGTGTNGVLFEYDIAVNTYTKKLNFAGTSNGSRPYGTLVQMANNKMYGMTYYGGVSGVGVIFEFDVATGTTTKKLDFAGTTNGSYPQGNLFKTSTGKLYGMTSQGGASNNGVLFLFDAATSTYTKKVDFAGATNGSRPYGTVMQASSGKLYGMTYNGGSSGQGVMFEYDTVTSTYTKKLDFVSGSISGSYPYGSLIKATNEKLYGMTNLGGINNLGVIFEYDPATLVYTKKLDFAGTSNGARPYGSLVQASNGKLYGMTQQGGVSNMGVLFEYNLTTSTYTKLLDFAGTTNGSYPSGSLMQASNGKLYGMTYQGGANNIGVMFEFDPATNTYTKKLDFAGTTNGSYPYGSFLQASNGKLYGMTQQGGTNNYGVLFEYKLYSNTYTKKINFAYTATGCYPRGTLIQASNGLLYGTTYLGGASGNGVIFKYDTTSSACTKELDFAGTTNGSYPYGNLMQAINGKIYGLTFQGGANNYGVIFQYDPITTSFTKKMDFNAANGKNPYYTQLIEICEQPKFTSSIADATICPGTNTDFITSATGNTLTYQWQVNIGAGFVNISNGGTYAHVTDDTLHVIAATSGMTGYQYRCLVSSACPVRSIQSDTAILTISPKPVASFTINNNSQCLSVNDFGFSNTSTGASTYLWNFGNGDTSSTKSPSHSYTSIGSYNVKLVAIFGASCKDSTTKSLDVRPQPISNFTINNNSQCLSGNSFDFTNTATGASTYLWNFGDASTSSATSPSHSFTTAGAFTVKLISTSSYGCKDSTTKTLDVRPAPISSFTINNNSQCLSGNNFAFTNTATGASNFLWNFGDATTSNANSPSHSYNTVGSYTVKLVSTSSFGCKDSITKTIDVRAQPVSNFTINNSSQCMVGNNFVFTNTATGASNYLWNFGDAATSNNMSPSHSYGSVGVFNVKLVSITSYGCKDSITKSADVKPKPVSSFTIDNNSQCLSSNNFGFSNTSTGAISYFWDFGNGDTSSKKSPMHSYALVGTYNVKLVSMVGAGCKDSITKAIYVRPHPISSFTINNNIQCLTGNNFVFTNTASGATTCLWNFGDAATSTTLSPSHSYTFIGAFTVKLVSITSFGCKDSTTKNLDVKPKPVAAFTINNNSQCLNSNSFVFTNTSTGAISYLWNFGSSSDTTSTKSPSHSYGSVGTYNVKLVSMIGSGCKDSVTKTVDVRPKPVSSFTVNIKSQCLNGNNFIFTNTSVGAATCLWNFGDAATSTTLSPSHSYSAEGAFNVKLVSETTYGCKDTTISVVNVRSPLINLGKDTTIYGTNSLVLNAGAGFDSYLWSNLTTNSTLVVSSSKNGFGLKLIWVKVTQNGCIGRDTIMVNIKKTISISEPQANYELKVFPNPVNNMLNIALSPIENEMIVVLTDMNGKQLKSIRIMPNNAASNHQMDVSEFAEGVYYLDISNSESRKFVKFVKY